MVFFEQLDEIDIPEDVHCHVAVGTFDGVHKGHQELLTRLARIAQESGGRSLVLTFQNHPRSIVQPDSCPPLLSPWSLKKKLLGLLDLDYVVGLEFDLSFSQTTPEDFVSELLVKKCRARSIHSGRNFHFGKGGRGGPALLEEMSPAYGYTYVPLEVVERGGKRISSTRIRETLLDGDVELAQSLLGRPHCLAGTVVEGDKLGRTIGFPTANLDLVPGSCSPADGVYAVRVRLDDSAENFPAMMNIGHRPTVQGIEQRYEVHLLDFDRDIVGNLLHVEFVAWLRAEKKFDGLEALKEQLGQDMLATREIFAAQ